MTRAVLSAAVCAAALATCAHAATATGASSDVLDRPAMRSQVAATKLLSSVALAGDRLVAVGHDGVVLATTDGGTTWIKQLDGRAVNDLVLVDIQAKLAANPESTLLQGLATAHPLHGQLPARSDFFRLRVLRALPADVRRFTRALFSSSYASSTWRASSGRPYIVAPLPTNPKSMRS